ncbi:MAG TPA: hypothetical protein VGG72_03285 [Bryobacteraceae bacterium]|jgi:hypothetical protein
MENANVEFIVMVKKPDGSWDGLAAHGFVVPPRTGEYVTLDDENGIGQAYRVTAVLHPLDATMTAGDLVLEYVSTGLELRNNL